jgi:hypothetical protein
MHSMRVPVATLVFGAPVLAVAGPAPVEASTKVDYGAISHKGFKTIGAASASLKLGLQIGFVANQSGLQSAVKSASNPASSSYGKYPSLSTLQSKYGAASSTRKSVVNAFKSSGISGLDAVEPFVADALERAARLGLLARVTGAYLSDAEPGEDLAAVLRNGPLPLRLASRRMATPATPRRLAPTTAVVTVERRASQPVGDVHARRLGLAPVGHGTPSPRSLETRPGGHTGGHKCQPQGRL